MQITLVLAPTVTLIARPQFLVPAHRPVHWVGEATDGERLVEFAGRLCYLSFANPGGKTTGEYLDHIKASAHGSVTAHATYSLLLEGISRSCAHELNRHAMGFARSELSQRFVDMRQHASFVVPPALLDTGDAAVIDRFAAECRHAAVAYEDEVDRLAARFKAQGQYADQPTLRRKRAREAARAYLPNSTETQMVLTGNVRAWRTVIEQRGDIAADLEIRRLAGLLLDVLRPEAPGLFDDYTTDPAGSIVTPYRKI